MQGTKCKPLSVFAHWSSYQQLEDITLKNLWWIHRKASLFAGVTMACRENNSKTNQKGKRSCDRQEHNREQHTCAFLQVSLFVSSSSPHHNDAFAFPGSCIYKSANAIYTSVLCRKMVLSDNNERYIGATNFALSTRSWQAKGTFLWQSLMYWGRWVWLLVIKLDMILS